MIGFHQGKYITICPVVISGLFKVRETWITEAGFPTTSFKGVIEAAVSAAGISPVRDAIEEKEICLPEGFLKMVVMP